MPSTPNKLKDKVAALETHLHAALCAHAEIMELLGIASRGTKPQPTPSPAPSGGHPGCPDRSAFSGLTDGEFGLFEVYCKYNDYDGDDFPGLIEHLTAWEHDFIKDWMDKPKVEWSLTPKQEKIFERIGEKLSYNIHWKVPDDGPQEEDYADDDIPF